MTHFLFVCVYSRGGMWVEVCVCGGGGLFAAGKIFFSVCQSVFTNASTPASHTHTHTQRFTYLSVTD